MNLHSSHQMLILFLLDRSSSPNRRRPAADGPYDS